MVLFLLHNTLGAWWAGKVLAANPAVADAGSEDELRAACAVGGVEWTYLRFVREETSPGVPPPERSKGGRKRRGISRCSIPAWAAAISSCSRCRCSPRCVRRKNGFRLRRDVGGAARQSLRSRNRPALHPDRGVQPRPRRVAARWISALPALHLACSGLSLGVSVNDHRKLEQL